jgi:DNA-binding CsgD family transcriptional regulator/tetratricopeptide (TPR) repeat protein
MSSPILIGRTDELAVLDAALAIAESGSTTTVLVGGDAGVGKSRLVTEFAARAAGRAATVLSGGCLPLAAGLVPYAPVIDLLSGVADRDVLDALPAGIGGTAPAASGPPQETDRSRLFYTLLALFERLAADSVLVLVVEDMHWADRSTRELLNFLAGTPRRCRLLLVATYRSDELPARHPLRHLTAELTRAGAHRVRLGPLGRRETADQLAGILRVRPDDELVERVYVRSEGNPFLTEELLAAGVGDGPLPESLRDVLLTRVRRLPQPTQRLLDAVAIAGRRVEHALLSAVAGPDEAGLLAGLREAVDQHILLAEPDGYAFRHALLAEAVAAELLPGERIGLHRAYAEALGRLAGRRAAEVAHHWLQARDSRRAYVACVAAGLAAERAWAFAEAQIHFERAIALRDEDGVTGGAAGGDVGDGGGLDMVGLYQHAAQAAFLVGDHERAIALVRDGLSAADLAADPQRAAVLHERMALYLLNSGRPESQTLAAVRSLVDRMPDEPTPARAQVLAALAATLMSSTRHSESLPWGEEALRVAESAGASDEKGHALSTLGVCHTQLGDVAAGIEHGRRSLALAQTLDNAENLYRSYLNLTDSLTNAGRLAEAAELALVALADMDRQQVQHTWGAFVLGNALYALYLLGRWDEMDRLLAAAPDAATTTPGVGLANVCHAASLLCIARGRFVDAQAWLGDVLRRFARSGHVELRVMVHVAHAELNVWQRRPAEASSTVDTTLPLLAATGHGSLLARLVALGLRARADLGPRRTPAGAPDLTAAVERVRSLAVTPMAKAHLTVVEAELSRASGPNDPQRWAVAAAEWGRLNCPLPQAYAWWRQAEALLRHHSERSAPTRLLGRAHHVATGAGAAPLRTEIEALARRARVRLGGPAPAVPAAPSAHGLTERELEVLRLLTVGSTNRQVARTLFISEKTVSIHVSRILAKLGAANRGEAAAIAHRLGLVHEPP